MGLTKFQPCADEGVLLTPDLDTAALVASLPGFLSSLGSATPGAPLATAHASLQRPKFDLRAEPGGVTSAWFRASGAGSVGWSACVGLAAGAPACAPIPFLAETEGWMSGHGAAPLHSRLSRDPARHTGVLRTHVPRLPARQAPTR